MAYMRGVYPPAHCSVPFGNCSIGNSDVDPLIAMHNMLLAHGKAANLYRENFESKQGVVIGIVIFMFMYEPLTDDKLDQEAATRALAFNVAWDELPRFSKEETKFINGSIDFIGVNHYSTFYAKDCTNSSCPKGGDHAINGFVYAKGERDGVPVGDLTGMENFFVVPRGMGKIINYIKNRYHNKPMYMTENGYASPLHQGVQDLLHDVQRIEYHEAYLASLAQAIRNGADVRGYFPWTLMDDFEWVHGYDMRFGLYYVDPKTLNRIPKHSAEWYKHFLRNISLEWSSFLVKNVKR